MKVKNLFHVRMDDVPVIALMILKNYTRDLSDFTGFSPVFTAELITTIQDKVLLCEQATRASVYTQELKRVSSSLYESINAVRGQMNSVEGYVKLSAPNLDVSVRDFGIRQVRKAISAKNAIAVPECLRLLLIHINRNLVALKSVGYPEALSGEIEARTKEIESLNVEQNGIESNRALQAESDMLLFNDLWSTLQPIIETGKALYRGVDSVKVKDYTISQLERRLHPSSRKSEASSPKAEEPVE